MLVRMITRAASPERTLEPGDEIHVDDEKALELINGGYAEAVRVTGETAKRSPAEMAVSPARSERSARALTDIPGIGKARAADLLALGIASVAELAAADANTVAAIDGVGMTTAQRWIGAAQEIT